MNKIIGLRWILFSGRVVGDLMRDQINKFARGVFEFEPPVLEVTEASIYAVVAKNIEYKNNIHIFERNQKELKGIIYSDNDKVVLEDNHFLGCEIIIPYSVKCKGALNDDVIEGAFHIICNGGEEQIPFSFRVEAGSFNSSVGVIRNLFHFTNLAQTNIEEAVDIFEKDDFENIYIGDNLQLRCVYEGLCKSKNVQNNIEEFLIAIHKKSRLNMALSTTEKKYSKVQESFRDSIIIEKDSWGYMQIDVECKGDFIIIDRNIIESDSFVGNKCEFTYVVDINSMRSGKNKGVIIFTTVTQKLVLQIEASKEYNSEILAQKRMIKKLNADVVDLYIKFRTHAINISEWIRESKIAIEAIRSIDDSSPYYRLALAQVLLAETKIQEAKELMENVKDEIVYSEGEDQILYCYMLYVNTLYNKDRSYSKKVTGIVQKIYEQNKNWKILWLLLFLDEELELNSSLKILRIKEQFNSGCNSPIMYLEACYLLNSEPVLLRILNKFELNTLLFGAKTGCLNEKLVNKIAEIIVNQKYLTAKHIQLLIELYKTYSDNYILECLCKVLIRNNCIGMKYLPIYKDGIEKELRITQLFEYYIWSRDLEDMKLLPKMVLMYFGYNNNLDYIHKAYLYANIILNKLECMSIYKSYFPQMKIFTEEQLLLGHINDCLNIVYNDIMDISMINKDNAGPISEIMFTYKITCSNQNFNKVIIRHKESNSEKEYALVNNCAYVRIFTDDIGIFFVNSQGIRYGTGISYKIEQLRENEEILKKCIEKDGNLIHLKLHYFEKNLKYKRKSLDSMEEIQHLLYNKEVNKYCKKQMISMILAYYYDSYDEEGFERFIQTIEFDELEKKELVEIIEIFIIIGKYERAFKLCTQYSVMDVRPKRLMKMCSKLIVRGEYENSEDLVRISGFVFFKGSFDDVVLSYLVDEYNGTTKEMIEIWQRAMEAGIDTYEIEERLIAQMLFSHTYSGIMAEIFDHYYGKGPDDRIVEAYLAYHSYLYFVKGKIIADEIFFIMETAVENQRDLELVCEMALLKNYSEKDFLNEFQKKLAEEIIFKLVRKNYMFDFYEVFNGIIRMPFNIVDKTIVEYHTNPNSRVVIHYIYEGKDHKRNYVSEDMKNVYEGIFIKEFVLFYGEELQYYISEENIDCNAITESCNVVKNNINPEKSEGRYEALNDIIACQDMHDAETFRKLIHKYAVNEYVVEQIFKPL